MARYFKNILFITSSLLLLTSCQEGGEAGDLFGQWRMTGSDTEFISFSGSIALLRDIQQGEVYGNFQHKGDSLFIQCYSINGIPSDTLIVEENLGFKPFNDIRVRIESVDGDRLILGKDQQHWSFYKY